jgi:hypothetical protein
MYRLCKQIIRRAGACAAMTTRSTATPTLAAAVNLRKVRSTRLLSMQQDDAGRPRDTSEGTATMLQSGSPESGGGAVRHQKHCNTGACCKQPLIVRGTHDLGCSTQQKQQDLAPRKWSAAAGGVTGSQQPHDRQKYRESSHGMVENSRRGNFACTDTHSQQCCTLCGCHMAVEENPERACRPYSRSGRRCQPTRKTMQAEMCRITDAHPRTIAEHDALVHHDAQQSCQRDDTWLHTHTSCRPTTLSYRTTER